jgi:DNA-binding transcriptional MocR family regulator
MGEKAIEALRAFAFGSPGIGALIAGQWLEDGTAQAILREAMALMRTRTTRVRQVLGKAVGASPLSAAPHLWLPMGELAAERVAGRAARRGVALTPPRAQVLEGAAVKGLRVCLGGPADETEFERGLAGVAWALGDEPEGGDAV